MLCLKARTRTSVREYGSSVCNLLLIEQFSALIDLAPLYKADELIASISILANCGSTVGYYVTMVYAVRHISFVRRLRLHDPATSSRYRHHREATTNTNRSALSHRHKL